MKNLKILFVSLFFVQFSFAQEIDLGVKLGANFSTISDIANNDNKTGFVGGAFLTLKFSKIGIQPELLYSQQGSNVDVFDFDLQYINVPVMLKYYVVGGLNLQVGPQFGFVVDDNLSTNTVLEAETFDFAGAAGIGLDLPLGLRADARYVFGFTDVLVETEGKNRFFTISLGYSFF